ncbi:MAG TPA: hypothetical protein VK634_19205 [Reyranella sp.]|nr:hypothetical protein [Reyranella sp.]
MPITKKVVGTSADPNVIGAPAERVQSQRLRAMLRTPWPWPRAAMVIILLSLLLWGGVAGIALLAFD